MEKLFKQSQALYQNELLNVRLTLKRHQYWVIALTCLTLFFSVGYFYAVSQQRLVLVPNRLHQSTVVSSRSYLLSIAADDVTNFFTFSPSNIQAMSAQFLERVSPSLYSQTQQQLLIRNASVKHDTISQVIYVGKKYFLTHSNRVVIEGHLKRWVANVAQPDRKMSIQIGYEKVNGIPYIVEWKYDEKN
jgi:hypothetical protein